MKAVSRSLVFRPPFSGQTPKLPTRSLRPFGRVVTVSCEGADGGEFTGEDADRRLASLRKRMHEMNMVKGKKEAPVDWMEWEKKYYVCYEEDSERVVISTIVKRYLRAIASPRMAVGVLGLVAVSAATMVFVVFFLLVEVSGEILNVLCHLFRKLP